MSILLALASAAVFGAADFLGGLTSRRATAFAVAASSQVAGTAVLLVALPLLPGTPDVESVLWGAAAGFGGGGGLVLFFHALANGTMSIVSPVTALLSAGLPLLAGLALGERPGWLATAGLLIGLVAVVLASRPSGAPEASAPGGLGTLRYALLAGTGFALFYGLLGQTEPASGLWPLLGARASSLLLFGVIAVTTRRSVVPPRGTWAGAAGAGLLDMAANVCFLLAVQAGLLSITAVLASLYPLGTLVLARTLLGERLAGGQRVGVGLALLAVALVAAR